MTSSRGVFIVDDEFVGVEIRTADVGMKGKERVDRIFNILCIHYEHVPATAETKKVYEALFPVDK